MRHWIYLVATGSLLAGQQGLAETVAITHAKAWTMTATEPVENATICGAIVLPESGAS